MAELRRELTLAGEQVELANDQVNAKAQQMIAELGEDDLELLRALLRSAGATNACRLVGVVRAGAVLHVCVVAGLQPGRKRDVRQNSSRNLNWPRWPTIAYL